MEFKDIMNMYLNSKKLLDEKFNIIGVDDYGEIEIQFAEMPENVEINKIDSGDFDYITAHFEYQGYKAIKVYHKSLFEDCINVKEKIEGGMK